MPEEIDYATGAVLVDIIPVKDWSAGSNMRERHYSDMLYTFDGSRIMHIPVRTSYWPEELLAKYNEIEKAEENTKKPLRNWGGKAGSRGSTGGGLLSPSGEPGNMIDLMEFMLNNNP